MRLLRPLLLSLSLLLPLSALAATTTLEISVQGQTRRALVHVPPAATAKAPLPLVLMFHGAGGTPENAARETGWTAKADSAGFIVVFPEATRPDASQPPKFGRNNPTWNDGSGRFHSGERAVADVAFIAALLDRLEKSHPVDPRRVFATGFSNGASMVFRLGAELSARFAAIAPVAGALWIAPPKLPHPVPLLYITGTKDPLNPLEGGAPRMAVGRGFNRPAAEKSEKPKPPVRAQIDTWAALLGCDPAPQPVANTPAGVTTILFRGGREGSVAVFTTLADHGHIWPGGKNFLPELVVGQATSRLNATDAIWEFFSRHSRPAPAPF